MSLRLLFAIYWFGVLTLACAPDDSGGTPSGGAGGGAVAGSIAGMGAAAGSTAGAGGAAAAAGRGGVSGGAAGSSTAGAGGRGGAAGSGAGGGIAGRGGASGASGRGGGAGSGTGGAAGAGGKSQTCLDLEADYARELPRFLVCSGSDRCGNRTSSAPGCICQIYVQEPAPLELETLMNIELEWFNAGCTMPVCTTPCPAANRGACQNGRCTTLP
jgi:hypothetical protein